jgi:hypothetical protein
MNEEEHMSDTPDQHIDRDLGAPSVDPAQADDPAGSVAAGDDLSGDPGDVIGSEAGTALGGGSGLGRVGTDAVGDDDPYRRGAEVNP